MLALILASRSWDRPFVRARLAFSLLLAACGAAPGPVARVVPLACPTVATVDGEPIDASEIVVRADAPPAVFTRALEDRVDALLIENAARALGVEVTDADVDAAIAAVPPLTGQPSMPELAIEPYRALIRENLLRFRVLQARMGSRVPAPSDEEVRARYDALVEQAQQDGTEARSTFRTALDVLRAQMRQERIATMEPTMMEELRGEAVIERGDDCRE